MKNTSSRIAKLGRNHKKRNRGKEMGAEEEVEQKGIELEQQPRSSTQPMTPAQFLSWKRNKDADASARKAEEARKRAEDILSGTVPMNGRELFLHDPLVFDNTRY
ncbi:hypothetical protein IFM89_032941 [Coptis chinensis]|uniref:ZC3H15/TMA46 family C-terminal domain-containing protein n=1 Tax=Coptis chinensis TaxID=261450 RepID=A0A835I6C9_9MAGN|nr:hypothetical protein IFM89_032941 [Coptis chinensis]